MINGEHETQQDQLPSAKDIKDEIRRAKQRWHATRNHDDAVKLHAIIDERRKIERSQQAAEKKRVFLKARLCRSFYETLFATQRKEFNEDCRRSVEVGATLAQQHRAARRERQQLAEYELSNNFTESRRRLKEVTDERHTHWKQTARDHVTRIEEHRSQHAAHLAHQQAEEQRRAIHSREVEMKVHSEYLRRRLADEAYTSQVSELSQRRLDNYSTEHVVERAASAHLSRSQRRSMRSFSRALHETRAFQRDVEHLEWEEQLARQRIMQSCLRLAAEHHGEFEAQKRKLRPHTTGHRCQSCPLLMIAERPALSPSPSPSPSVVRASRAEQRIRAHELAVEERRRAAQTFRKSRLLDILRQTMEEGERINQLRLKTLEHHRGEKSLTEGEPFVVPSGLSSLPEALPDSARERVLEILRGSQW